MASKIDLRRGGYALRVRRTELDLTLEDVSRLTDGVISTMEASRLELGRFSRPSYEAVTVYGMAMGWTPNDIARHFGLWAGEPEQDEQVAYIMEGVKKLTKEQREAFLKMVVASLNTML